MKNLTKKCAALYCLFLLMTSYALDAAKSVYEPSVQVQKVGYRGVPSAKRKLLIYGYCRTYYLPTDLFFFIRCLVYDNPLKYRNKTLPNDLSGEDLSGFDFTGCHFTYANLTDTNLADVILTHTTCDYQKAFQDNIKKNKLRGGDWYKENLPKDLKSIAEVYHRLNNDTHKAKLLQIACGLSRLPFYKDTEFYIKVAYWSCALLQLKQTLGNPYDHQLVCSLTWYLNDEANNYCWKTNYPQDKVSIDAKNPHANFAQYLKNFTSGLSKYQCNSKQRWYFDYYKKQITENIEGLATIYPNIKNKELQRAACGIGHALSKSYQIQKEKLLFHYLFYQNRLISLKKLVDLGVKNDIHYSIREEMMFLLVSWIL